MTLLLQVLSQVVGFVPGGINIAPRYISGGSVDRGHTVGLDENPDVIFALPGTGVRVGFETDSWLMIQRSGKRPMHRVVKRLRFFCAITP